MTAALFCRETSVYRTIPGVDVWDKRRDAATWPGGEGCIAHPPCRAWGRYHHRANPDEGERELALLAVRFIRENGGVLEHPAGSKLWREAPLPRPGEFPDEFGGYAIAINQGDFGHRAIKPTWLYIVGVPSWRLPAMPPPAPGPFVPVEHMCRAERERTPQPLAEWLVQLVGRL